jgi:hypothetical protein
MSSHAGGAVLTGILYVLAGLTGLIVATIVVLNLHIIVGLEEGYAASPAEVIDRSWVLAAADVCVLVGGPALAVAAMARVRDRR